VLSVALVLPAGIDAGSHFEIGTRLLRNVSWLAAHV
jgi:hypothetical protein